MKANNGSHSLARFALTGKQDYPLFAFTSHLHLFLIRKENDNGNENESNRGEGRRTAR